jgi:membrane protease YdiL (CAAX protease family)
VALVGYALFVEPVWGWFEYRRLEERRDSDPRALVRAYRILLVAQWSWTALVLVAVALSPGLDLAAIGVRAPVRDDFVLAASLSGAIALVASAFAIRSAARKGKPIPGQDAFSALLPRTGEERRHAVAAAITAGICEEVLYRGFFIAVGVRLFHLSPTAAAVLSVVVFLVAHAYQGWRGALSVTGLAILLTIIYVRSASLLLPIVLHALVDLRALLLVRPGAASPSSPG